MEARRDCGDPTRVASTTTLHATLTLRGADQRPRAVQGGPCCARNHGRGGRPASRNRHITTATGGASNCFMVRTVEGGVLGGTGHPRGRWSTTLRRRTSRARGPGLPTGFVSTLSRHRYRRRQPSGGVGERSGCSGRHRHRPLRAFVNPSQSGPFLELLDAFGPLWAGVRGPLPSALPAGRTTPQGARAADSTAGG